MAQDPEFPGEEQETAFHPLPSLLERGCMLICEIGIVAIAGVVLTEIVTRNLLRFVDALPVFYFVGGITCWLNPKCQRLGDIAANTIVIRNPRVAQPDLDQLSPGKFN